MAKYEEALEKLQAEIAKLPDEIDSVDWKDESCTMKLWRDRQLRATMERALPELKFFKEHHKKLLEMRLQCNEKIYEGFYVERMMLALNLK